MTKRKKIVKRFIWALLIFFVLINLFAFFHAYKFTHFADGAGSKTSSPEKLSSTGKLTTLLLGVSNPRPAERPMPPGYRLIELQSNKRIACWYLKKDSTAKIATTKGTVILFHGYGGDKSSLVSRAEEFIRLNYNVLLVDFMGSGGSEGNQTTLGFQEAAEVRSAFKFVEDEGEKNICLFGTSMGAVAVMKAISDYDLSLKGIILECPFGSMYATTCARFKMMHAPVFPMAALLVFWGGVQNDFWAFGHKPTEYAKSIYCPTLLLYGEQDKNVSRQEINEIYKNLQGEKVLKTYKLAGHEDYLSKYKTDWIKDVSTFLADSSVNHIK